ncbi:receptor-type tyrosine-protein phosphatase N2 [Sorex araneus]|uniref:receptor-type tyrosine-protein phosphatase N2 n=1 Tax=Sorex araneus TaxID=42254 RepID=UPI002433E16A|nr:receptor-type tyrosine-protein phosphatase N2 [Sorex araneus]
MGRPPLPLLLLLLLPALGLPAAPAPRRQLPGRAGCLFRDGLCGDSELCVDDGAFGRCQWLPAMDTPGYPVSLGTQRLRASLQQPPHSDTGLPWQEDGHAPHTAARELADLLGVPPRHPARPAPQSTSMGRSEPLDRGLALATALQRFLPYLEALSRPPAPDGRSWARSPGAAAQDGDPLAAPGQAPALTYAPEPRRRPPDQLSPQADSGVDGQSLAAALGEYVARNAALAPRRGPPAGHGPLPGLRGAPQKLPTSAADLLDSGSDARIRELLKDPVKPRADGGTWDPVRLDEMVLMLSGPEQTGLEGTAGGQPGEQGDGSAALHGAHSRPGHSGPDGGAEATLEVDAPRSSLAALGPPRTAVRKSEAPDAALSSEEERAGLENVRSQTYFRALGPGQRGEPAGGQDGQSPGAQGHTDPDLRLEVKSPSEPGYVVTDRDPLSLAQGAELLGELAHLLDLPAGVFWDVRVLGPTVTFRVSPGVHNLTEADAARAAADSKDRLQSATGLKVLGAGVGPGGQLQPRPQHGQPEDSTKFAVLTLVSVAAIVGVLLASGATYCLRHGAHRRLQEKLGGPPGPDCTAAYQELCRQRMSGRPSERPEAPHTSRVNSVSSQFSDGPVPSPSARSSTSSWSEEPVQPNMDISTGHMVLAYMEDHLRNKGRLQEEWRALCTYQAEPGSTLVAQCEENVPKNRCPGVLAYDHSRVLLKVENGHSQSDYINASPIMDHDPRSPAYIAAQGPLPTTVADFWQMVWESGCVVVVMLTPLAEAGVPQCHHYWPDEGSCLYHIYEVNLVSEHIWCEDFLVRSFYLKNVRTQETRTVTQFHFVSWYDRAVPASTRSLLDFRRKVNKCYRGRSCPIIVHCSDGAGRSGTYVLIDMVLNKMAKGAKEIDIAATLEHLRDQRPGMVQTKEQFEFALTAVAEEVNAILQALPQ